MSNFGQSPNSLGSSMNRAEIDSGDMLSRSSVA